jgi:hypothetical protein
MPDFHEAAGIHFQTLRQPTPSRSSATTEGPGAQSRRDALGLVPFWAKDIKVGFSNINAKAD